MASALKGMSEGGRERGRRTKGKKKSRSKYKGGLVFFLFLC